MKKEDMPYGYVIDTRIRAKYHSGYTRPDQNVSHFIIHGTGGGQTAEANLKWMLLGGEMPNGRTREEQYKQGQALFQYIIDRDGKIIEIINPHNWVYHSSTGVFDSRTIGVELTNPDRENGGGYTDMQYKALSKLYLWLSEIFINMKTIQGHGLIKLEKTGSGKVCPGNGFAWMKLNSLLIDDLKQTVYHLKSEKIEIL